jgi:hypothetical protein
MNGKMKKINWKSGFILVFLTLSGCTTEFNERYAGFNATAMSANERSNLIEFLQDKHAQETKALTEKNRLLEKKIKLLEEELKNQKKVEK